ncbi:TrlF family AAA-like ATPase [Geovibrio ferrireducens]|uniref:TrlF family AAA-like ATPase n=1 Tax=Geovibrio ferrireducens TaxID=46201 RepID=UPI0022466775|nr:AAA family ATPase [Geovibrio ferrireducens]
MNNFSRGSEWRKWDLHIHTPKSICHHYGGDTDDVWEKFISDLEKLPSEFAVLGINDYLFLDGYERLTNEQKNNNRLKGRKLLPVLEFRIEKFAGVQFENLKRINLHVIFSDELSLETIKSHFLNTLEQSYKLDSGRSWTRAITRESVAELGKEIKSTVPAGELQKYKTDIVEGFNNLSLDEKRIFDSLKKDCFNNKYLIAIGKTEWDSLKWTDSSISTKKTIINSADLIFTSSDSIEIFKNAKAKLIENGVKSDLLDCSDAHHFSYSSDKDRIGNCFTWIKADPTFDGLRQALNEFNDRVFIGEIPELFLRINHKRTKYIKNIKINSVETYSDKQGQWFKNIDIPINSELVSIIGNKGSGKSALADIIALCGNYKDHDSFSFLHKERFKKEKLAENFRATLLWESEDRLTKNLQETNSNTEVEIVKYIPQKKFENLTNEIKSVEAFQKEIEKVVFAHFDDSEKMKLETFQDYIDSHKKTIELEIDMLVGELKKINDRVISLENMQTKEYRAGIEKRLELKQKDYDALIPPVAVIDPNSDPAKKIVNGAKLREIDDLAHSIELLEQNLSNIRLEKNNHLVDIQQLGNFKKEVEIKVQELDKLLENKKDILESFDLNISEIVSLNIDYSKLDTIMTVKKLLISNIDKQLSVNEGDSSIANQIIIQKNELQNIRAALNSEQIQYQNYLIQKKEWEDNRKLIMGDNETPDTIMYLKDTISYLDEKLANELKEEFKKRILKTREIFKNKNEIIKLYKKIKEKVDTVIEENRDVLQSYGINIDASFVPQNTFQSKFFSFINQKRAGTFYTVEGSIENLNTLCDEIDFNNENSIILFLENIIKAFNVDLKKDVEHFIGDQVNDRAGLYKYLFSLDFLDYNYQLKQGGKQLQQLSPGERGALLLVFYLLLDKSDIPLMIDQPEDNLDNQSVAKVLVPFIKKAKKKRQIIMVTHNPNLAVVADSEQVIYVNIEKENNNKFAVISGSIENKEINEKIVQVLEGTMPAFNKRKEKYYYE